jgi:hypothetical protein
MKVGSVAGVVLFVTIVGVQQSTTSATPRRSYFQQHSSLLSQLQAEDKDVEVTRLGSIPFVQHLPVACLPNAMALSRRATVRRQAAACHARPAPAPG